MKAKSLFGNLTLVQAILALMVIGHHAIGLSGASAPVWMEWLFGSDGITLGGLAVHAFMVLSGYMLAVSSAAGPNWFEDACAFIVKRLTRIFPVVLFGTLVAVFVVGPLFTRMVCMEHYFSNMGTWIYFQNALLFVRPPTALPGVFDENAFPSVVNGVMWMIPWLMWFYTLMTVCIILRVVHNRVFVGILYLASLTYCANLDSVDRSAMFCGIWLHDGIRLLPFFVSGWLAAICRTEIRLDVRTALAILLLMPFWFRSPCATVACSTFGSYALLSLTFETRPTWISLHLPPISFGLFIFGFMVQQSLVCLWGGRMDPLLNFILATVITVPLALLSQKTVERGAGVLRQWILGALEKNKHECH